MSNKTTLEDKIEDYLVAETLRRGGQALKLRPPVGRGFPDRTLLLPCMYTAFVETKRPVGGRVSAQQEKEARAIRRTGHRYFTLTTVGEVDMFFRSYDDWVVDSHSYGL